MKEIVGLEELDNFIIENAGFNNVIVLYFGAVWCGPCKHLKQRLTDPETTNIMPKLAVGYLDVEEESNGPLVNKYKVKSLPTQVFIKLDKNKVVPVSRIEGYDFTKLRLEYDNYLTS